jgi:glycosyltransferase involved in cell wall biosynthesis
MAARMSPEPVCTMRMLPARPAAAATTGLVTTERMPTLTASVVIAAFASDRWVYLRGAVASVAGQTRPALETIVVIDHNPDLLARARSELTAIPRGDGPPYPPQIAVIPNAGARGASGARNTGVARSRGDVVVFLDDDARAAPDWLARLLGHFADPGVVGVGGRVDPLWATARPRWFPGEFDWAVGASYTGMPERTARVRNVWSNNMAVRRTSFAAAGGFREGFGKVGAVSRPEDTDLCLRVTDGAWLYDPAGAVGHWVPPHRASFRYFLVRCFNEGLGKAGLAALNGAAVSTSQERGYAARVLPRAVSRGLREAAHGDGTGALRGGAIIAGLGAAAAGYAVGAATAVLARDPRAAPGPRIAPAPQLAPTPSGAPTPSAAPIPLIAEVHQ